MALIDLVSDDSDTFFQVFSFASITVCIWKLKNLSACQETAIKMLLSLASAFPECFRVQDVASAVMSQLSEGIAATRAAAQVCLFLNKNTRFVVFIGKNIAKKKRFCRRLLQCKAAQIYRRRYRPQPCGLCANG
jgi:hypothetical protein